MRGIISSFVLSLFFRVGIANATYSPGPRAAMTESDASIGQGQFEVVLWLKIVPGVT